MNVEEIEQLRINILNIIYEKTGGILNKHINNKEIYNMFNQEMQERINSELLYLFKKGYIHGYSITALGRTEVLMNPEITEYGIDFIHDLRMKRNENSYREDISVESFKKFSMENINNSQIIINSPGASINQIKDENIQEILALLDNVKKKAIEEGNQSVEQLAEKISQEIKAGSSIEKVAGMFESLIAIGGTIITTVSNPEVQKLIMQFLGVQI